MRPMLARASSTTSAPARRSEIKRRAFTRRSTTADEPDPEFRPCAQPCASAHPAAAGSIRASHGMKAARSAASCAPPCRKESRVTALAPLEHWSPRLQSIPGLRPFYCSQRGVGDLRGRNPRRAAEGKAQKRQRIRALGVLDKLLGRAASTLSCPLVSATRLAGPSMTLLNPEGRIGGKSNSSRLVSASRPSACSIS